MRTAAFAVVHSRIDTCKKASFRRLFRTASTVLQYSLNELPQSSWCIGQG